MGAAGGMVEEEGLVRGVDVGVQDELDGMIDQVFVQVIAFVRHLGLGHRMVVVGQVGKPLVGLAAEKTVIALEATTQRPAVERAGRRALLGRGEVPLAGAEGVVAVLQQHLRQHAVLKRHPAVITGKTSGRLHDGRDAIRVVVPAGQDARASGRTQGRRVHVGVAQAVLRQPLDIGSVHQPAKDRHLAIAHIIQHKEDDVGRAFPGPHRLRPGCRRFGYGPADYAGECGARFILFK